MIELCVDTSSATTVALVRDGEILSRTRNDSGRHHAESITPLVHEALMKAGLPEEAQEAGIARIHVGTGPAPFTGLRAGLISARVFGRALNIPVYGVSSLDVIARQALDVLNPDTTVAAISDARRKELYWGFFVADGADDVRLLGELEVGSASTLLNSLHHTSAFIVVSDSLPAHSADVLHGGVIGPIIELDPAVMARIVSARLARGETERLSVEPLYLRRPDIQGQPVERL